VFYCANDATLLVPLQQPVAPAPPKRTYGLLALILAIVLVVVVAVGAFLWLRPKTDTGGPAVTPSTTVVTPSTTTPAGTDWTRGVTQQWQQTFSTGLPWWASLNDGSFIATSPDVWLVAEDNALNGIDPSSGAVMWHITPDNNSYSKGCASTLVNGQWACLEADPATSTYSLICLINATDGQQNCLSLPDVQDQQPGWQTSWVNVWFADNALIVAGIDWPPAEGLGYRAVARISLPSLSTEWAKSYAPGDLTNCNFPTPGMVRQGDTQGLTGDVLWFSGAIDTGPLPDAIDIRNGQSLFAGSSEGCDQMFPLGANTFTATPGLPAGSFALNGGSQITVLNAGGSIEYKTGQFPRVPVYITPSQFDNDIEMYGQATLGSNGNDWPVTLPMQQMQAAGGAEYLRGAAVGDTLVVVGGEGHVAAVDTATGQQIWTATVPAGDATVSNVWVGIVGNVVAVSTSDYDNGDTVTLLSLADGQTVQQLPGVAVVPPSGDVLTVVGQIGSADPSGAPPPMTVSRYVPVQ